MGSKLQQGVNDLLTWCKNNGEWGQQLIDEWVGLDEEGNHIEISEVARGSKKKVQWKCLKEGHKWVTTVKNRTINNSGCPYCSGKIVNSENNLKVWCKSNGNLGKRLLSEWVGEDEHGNKINISEVMRSSHKIVLWKCSLNKEHVWKATINHRTIHRSGCPYCAGQKVDDTNSLYSWCMNNKEYGQKIMKEFKGIDENMNAVDIHEVLSSSRKKVVWQCCNNAGHEWIAAIYHRTLNKSGCPYCNKIGTSYPEQLIYQALKCLYPECENRVKYFKDTYNNGLEYDIAIKNTNIFIEYSPSYTHQDREERDIEKAKACIENNIRLLYISDNYIYDTKSKEYTSIEDNDIDMLNKVLKLLGHSIDEIDLESIKSKAYDYSHGDIPKDKQLISVYPELAKEIHPDLNNIDLSKIAVGSCKKVYFKCTKCGYGSNGEWSPRIVDRTRGLSGCPNCGWNWYEQGYKQAKHKGQSKTKHSFWDALAMLADKENKE